MERLLGLDAQLIHDAILLMINIFFLFVLLSYLLFEPVRDFLNKRREKIQTELDSAAKNEQDALALKAEYEAKLKEINKEADEIMNEARKRAKGQEAEIIAEAKAEAGRIIARAQNEIVLEKKKALDDMKKEVVSIASMMAAKALSEAISTQAQNALIDETLKEMGESTWLS